MRNSRSLAGHINSFLLSLERCADNGMAKWNNRVSLSYGDGKGARQILDNINLDDWIRKSSSQSSSSGCGKTTLLRLMGDWCVPRPGQLAQAIGETAQICSQDSSGLASAPIELVRIARRDRGC